MKCKSRRSFQSLALVLTTHPENKIRKKSKVNNAVKVAIVKKDAKHTENKTRIRQGTDRAWFSHLI